MLKFDNNEEFSEGLFLTLSGIVRHKIHDEYNRMTKIGIEFDSMDEENRQTIERLVLFLGLDFGQKE